ncbi:5-formyltetrahydrofolate cyclo-ligase [Staphylococcus durrellii]|uniref:5-formyltetrahydrofolate cyclo-ligase n=1 Tax=Staphylococcus durrellii TaxID=2781773 RepID=UPI0018A11441|nr:5-formyltetrahydrofolate cyclo-ligase [Staphylococcus durrellii]MBF7017014.1 5-formyltetrahydrofolate cyclo-ligase [Staphylococcus durrellii]
MTKVKMRKQMLNKMKSFSGTNKQLADDSLARQLYETTFYQEAQKVGIVLSMPHEVNTYKIIKHMFEDKKQVFVPETNYELHSMIFKEITDLATIELDSKGINHVIADNQTTENLDLLIVPGIIFNQHGYRIGYGGGYFDKYLANHKQDTISLIYDFQIDAFEIEGHDQPVDAIIIATT